MTAKLVFNSSIGCISFIAHIKPESLADSIKDYRAFNGLMTRVLEAFGYSAMDSYAFKLLPLGDHLQGQWLGSSPCGMEFSNPPAQWMFDQRIDDAFNMDDIPMAIFEFASNPEFNEKHQIGMDSGLELNYVGVYLVELKRTLASVGLEVTEITTFERPKSYLDELFDQI